MRCGEIGVGADGQFVQSRGGRGVGVGVVGVGFLIDRLAGGGMGHR